MVWQALHLANTFSPLAGSPSARAEPADSAMNETNETVTASALIRSLQVVRRRDWVGCNLCGIRLRMPPDCGNLIDKDQERWLRQIRGCPLIDVKATSPP